MVISNSYVKFPQGMLLFMSVSHQYGTIQVRNQMILVVSFIALL